MREVFGVNVALGDISAVNEGEALGSGVIVSGKNGVRLGGGVSDWVGVLLAVGGRIYAAIS